MADDEQDYLSDAYLQTGAEPGHVDPRYDLPSWKRKAEVDKRMRETLEEQRESSKKRIKEKEEEAREQGLQAPISKDNKGFAMLMKMGFAEGAGLGKHNEGRAEPVPVVIKQGRAGLGKDSAKRQRIAMRAEMKVMRAHNVGDVESQFLARVRSKANSKQVLRDLYNAQRACEQLDTAMGLERNEFWPQRAEREADLKLEPPAPSEEDKSESESALAQSLADFTALHDTQKLQIVSSYLRKAHAYCVWCGTEYDTVDELESKCPGSTYEDHE